MAAPATISGVVSASAALLEAVTVKDSSMPAREVRASVQPSTGEYSAQVDGATPPYVICASVSKEVPAADGTVATEVRRVYAVSDGGGNANVNALTDAALAAATGLTAEAVYDAPAPVVARAVEALPVFSDALGAVLAPLLERYGVTTLLDSAASGATESLLRDVDFAVLGGELVVTVRATGAVAFRGPAEDPSRGMLFDANLPAAAVVGEAPPPADPGVAEPRVVVPPRTPPVTVLAFASMPSMAEPRLRDTATFADLGTTVTRVADGPHHYAKDTPWNADESLARLNDGTILDATTWQPTGPKVRLGGLTTWAGCLGPSAPADCAYYLYGFAGDESLVWRRADARSGAVVDVKRFSSRDSSLLPGLSGLTYGAYNEGSGGGQNNSGMSAVDLVPATAMPGHRPLAFDAHTGAIRCVATGGPSQFGSVLADLTVSPDGTFLVAMYGSFRMAVWSIPEAGGPDTVCPFVKSVDVASVAGGGGGHVALCKRTDGENVAVWEHGWAMGLAANGSRPWKVYDFDRAHNAHVSCANVGRPGWVYVSAENSVADSLQRSSRVYQMLFAAKLDGSANTVERFAWMHVPDGNDYAGMPMAAPSPSGAKVWWKANWDGRASGVHSYVATMR